jgi:hypothetical protein
MADRSGERSEWEARAWGDVVDALQGIGVELEALVMIARALATEKLGRDPLEGSIYAQRDEEDS